MSAYLYQYVCLEGTFALTPEGKLLHITDITKEVPWFKDTRTKKPMIPAKRRSFVSLVKQMIRDGDI